MDFNCDKCGLCCRHLELFGKEYEYLNRGDGICKYLVLSTNSCSIYTHRPIICNVKEGYKFFSDKISYESYLKKNYEACNELKLRFQKV